MARRPRRASLQQIAEGQEDWMHVNKRGQRVFRPGYDAKLGSAIRRVQDGTHDQWDEMVLRDPEGILADTKVAESQHFQTLLADGDPRQLLS